MEFNRRELFNILWVLKDKLKTLNDISNDLSSLELTEQENDELECDKTAIEMLLARFEEEV